MGACVSKPVSCFHMSDADFEDHTEKQFGKIKSLSKQSPATPDYENASYSVTNGPRSLALILANENFYKSGKLDKSQKRKGNSVDLKALVKLFKKQKLQVIRFNDLSGERMKAVAERTATHCNDHEVDMFVCAILSHGSNKDDGKEDCETIVGSDCKKIPTSEIINSFDCQGLERKLKLIFIQACRGSGVDMGVQSSAEGDRTRQSGPTPSSTNDAPDAGPDPEEPYTEVDPHEKMSGPPLVVMKGRSKSPTPSGPPPGPPSGPPEEMAMTIQDTQADVLVMYATHPEYISWRHTIHGSRFIEKLCAALQDYDFMRSGDSESGTVSLLRILTYVANEVALYENKEYTQMPMIVTSLTKDVLMKPIGST